MSNLSTSDRVKYLRLLYRTCGYHALLPRTLSVLVSYDRTSDALYRGGFGDVWKGEYRGRDVAVKVIRTYSNGDSQKITHVCFRSYPIPAYCVLILLYIGVLQGGSDMEVPSTPKYPTTNRGSDARDSACNGIELDVTWEHQ